MLSGDVVVCHPNGFLSEERLRVQNSLLQEVIGLETSSSRHTQRLDIFNRPCPDVLSLPDQFCVLSTLPSEVSDAPTADRNRFFCIFKKPQVGSRA